MHDHITFYTLKTTSVTGFIKTLGDFNTITIFNADVVYDCDSMRSSIIISIQNALYFNCINHSLIPPFVMRFSGLDIY